MSLQQVNSFRLVKVGEWRYWKVQNTMTDVNKTQIVIFCLTIKFISTYVCN